MSQRLSANVDYDKVDELAVEWACQGTPMELNRDETIVAIRRMLGKQPLEEIARRCQTNERRICRLLNAIGAPLCPNCRQFTFITDGVIEHHIHWRQLDACGASNRRVHPELEVAS